jgi:hypothetical protein
MIYSDDYLDTTTTRALFNARDALKKVPVLDRNRVIAIGDTLMNLRPGRPSDAYREAVSLFLALPSPDALTAPEEFAKRHRDRENEARRAHMKAVAAYFKD